MSKGKDYLDVDDPIAGHNNVYFICFSEKLIKNKDVFKMCKDFNTIYM